MKTVKTELSTQKEKVAELQRQEDQKVGELQRKIQEERINWEQIQVGGLEGLSLEKFIRCMVLCRAGVYLGLEICHNSFQIWICQDFRLSN